jgi:RHS repeat-associated protein
MRFNYADGRLPISMLRGGTTYYMMYDQVGSLRVIVDTSGNITKRIDYDSFGNIINDTDPGFTIPFGFAGGLHDIDTGLVRFGARDFDPSIGRWTAKDPIDFAGGDVNLYGYVQNNPVNLIDPLGLIDPNAHIPYFNERREAGKEAFNKAFNEYNKGRSGKLKCRLKEDYGAYQQSVAGGFGVPSPPLYGLFSNLFGALSLSADVIVDVIIYGGGTAYDFSSAVYESHKASQDYTPPCDDECGE